MWKATGTNPIEKKQQQIQGKKNFFLPLFHSQVNQPRLKSLGPMALETKGP